MLRSRQWLLLKDPGEPCQVQSHFYQNLSCLSKMQIPGLSAWCADLVPGMEATLHSDFPGGRGKIWTANPTATAPWQHHSLQYSGCNLTIASNSTKDHVQSSLQAPRVGCFYLLLMSSSQQPGDTDVPMLTLRGNTPPQKSCWESNFRAQKTLQEFPKHLLSPLLFLFVICY